MFRASILVLLAVVAPSTVLAANATFDNRADFLAQSSDITTLDFAGIAPPGGLTAFTTASGLTLEGVNFTGPSGAGFRLNVVDDTFCCPTYSARGDNAASLANDAKTATNNARIEVTLPDGITAIGMDLFVVVSGDAAGVLTDTINVTAGGTTYGVETVPVGTGNGRVFFGLISDSPIASLTIAPSRADNAAAEVVDFAFGAGVVPVPAALWFFAPALLALHRIGRRG